MRAFVARVPPDAPRGALIAAPGTGDWATRGAITGGAAARSAARGSARIVTDAVDARAATGVATPAPMTQPTGSTPSGKGAKVGIAVGAVALLAIAFFGYRAFSGGSPAPPAPRRRRDHGPHRERLHGSGRRPGRLPGG